MQGAEESAAPTAADPGAADAAQGNEGAADAGGADQGGSAMRDCSGADIELGHRVEVVGEEQDEGLIGQCGVVDGFGENSVLVLLDGFASEFRFEPKELKSHGKPGLHPQAAWPFPKQTEAA
jgi:hypothetical protein